MTLGMTAHAVAYRERLGRAAQTAINKGSVGIGKKMDSTNEKSPSIGIALGFCANSVHFS